MSTHGCACQRLDQIESSLIRTRAFLAQQERALLEVRQELEMQDTRMPVDSEGVIEPLEKLEKRAIERALQSLEPSAAAKALGIGKSSLYRRLHEYGWDLATLSIQLKGTSAS